MNTANLASWRENNPVPDLEPWLTGKNAQSIAVGSAVALLAGVLLARPSLAAVTVLTVIVLGVPIILGLADRIESGPVSPALSSLRILSPPAALFALLSVMAGSGFFAGLFSLFWLAFAVAVGSFGLLRLLSRPIRQRHAVGADLALILIGAGGVFLTLAQVSGSAALLRATVIIYVAGVVGTMVIALAPPMLPENCRLAQLVTAGALIAATLTVLHPRLGIIGSALLLGVAVSISRRLLTGADAVPGAPGRFMRIAAGSLILSFVLAPLHLILTAVDLRRFDLSFLTANELIVGSWSIAYQTVDGIAALVIATTSSAYVVAALVGLSRTTPSSYAEARAFTFHAGPRLSAEMAELLNFCASQPASDPLSLDAADPPAGYNRSNWSVPVASFDNSCDAVLGWAGHEAAGVTLYPPQPQISAGETFALAVPLGPVTVTAACRITDIVDEEDRYGFAYTTLRHHLWEGSESIIVSRDPDGSAKVTGTILWRPTSIGAILSRRLTEQVLAGLVTSCLEGIAAAETALVGDYLSSIVQDVSSRKMTVSRDALVQRTASPVVAGSTEPDVEESTRWDSGWDPIAVDSDVANPETEPALDLGHAAEPSVVADFGHLAEPQAAADSGPEGEPELAPKLDLAAEESVVFDPADLFSDLETDEIVPAETGLVNPANDAPAAAESDRLSFDEVFSQPFDSPNLSENEFDVG